MKAAYARYQAKHNGHGDDGHEEDAGDDHAEEAVESDEANAAYDDVLAARDAEKQARRDRGCYTGVAVSPGMTAISQATRTRRKSRYLAASGPQQRRGQAAYPGWSCPSCASPRLT